VVLPYSFCSSRPTSRVELLVGATISNVCFKSDRIVPLHEWVQQFMN
jgi:hypothetical protein